jgi:hypothetical protein
VQDGRGATTFGSAVILCRIKMLCKRVRVQQRAHGVGGLYKAAKKKKKKKPKSAGDHVDLEKPVSKYVHTLFVHLQTDEATPRCSNKSFSKC